MVDERLRHRAYTREHGDDPPELRDWTLALRAPSAGAGELRGAGLIVRVLVVNAGSSSLKLTLLDGDDRAARRAASCRRRGRRSTRGELRDALEARLGEADAVGHRIVHGGERFREPVRIDAGRRGARCGS